MYTCSDEVQNLGIIKLSSALIYTSSKLIFDKSSSNQNALQCLNYSDSTCQLALLPLLPTCLTEELNYKACTTLAVLKNTFSYTLGVSYSKQLLQVSKNNSIQVSFHYDTPPVLGLWSADA